MYHENTTTAGPAATASKTTAITPTPFAFDSQALRVILRDGQPWFIAKDVAACLGIANHWDMIERLDPDEKGLGVSDTPGGPQEMAIINEAALYFIMIRCNGATKRGTPAHTFRRWVTHEVLPAIRKTGAYSAAADPVLARARQLLDMGFTNDQAATILSTGKTRGKAKPRTLAVIGGHPLPDTDDEREALFDTMARAILDANHHATDICMRLPQFVADAMPAAKPWADVATSRPASTSLGMFLRNYHDRLVSTPAGNWRFHIINARRSHISLRKV